VSRPLAAGEPDDDAFGEFLSGVPDTTAASQQSSAATLSAAGDVYCIPDNGAATGLAAVKQNQTGKNLSCEMHSHFFETHAHTQPFYDLFLGLPG